MYNDNSYRGKFSLMGKLTWDGGTRRIETSSFEFIVEIYMPLMDIKSCLYSREISIKFTLLIR